MSLLKRALLAAALGVLVVGGAGGFFFWRTWERAHAEYKGFDEDEIFYTVEPGASGAGIASGLEELGVIEDGRVFRLALRIRGESGQLKAGEYRFAGPMSTVGVLERLVAGDVYTFAVTVPEGLTAAETAAHLASQGLAEEDALADAFRDVSLAPWIEPGAADLEGYLFPTTYRFTRNPSPRDVARTMLAQFQSVFDESKRERAQALDLTLHEVVTLASIVEKETGSEEERPLVASVFWNRLERGMALASDPTIIYALKMRGTWDGNLRRADLELESPYNTYRVPGIPPGPIASPGEASINAVLDPPETSYLYFVSKNDGTSHFSTTFREHQNAVQKYQVEYFRRRRARRNGDGTS